MEKSGKLKYIAAIGVLTLVIIGLCAYIFIDFRADSEAERSGVALARAGMNGSARGLNDDISAGDMTLAYHHASEAAEYAELCGETDACGMFRSIASSIRNGSLDTNVTAVIDDFLVSGLMPDEIPFFETEGEEVSAVSAEVYSKAKECASRFFGGAVLTGGQQNLNGEILFSVSNAYAVIDGEKCVPVEAAISLDEGNATLGQDECVGAAMKFISDFFPSEIAASARINRVEPSGGCRADVYAESCGVEMQMTVRRDTGRVVRFVSRVK